VTGGKSSQVIAEVELELQKGEPSHLIDAARALVEALPLRLGVLTRLAGAMPSRTGSWASW
jgi:inorganic triphosphatase YgiF